MGTGINAEAAAANADARRRKEENISMEGTEKTSIYLIGIGPGSAGCLTREAVQAIRQADVRIGASRMLQVCEDICGEEGHSAEETCYDAYLPNEVMNLIRKHTGETIALLFSGDIGFYSGAKRIRDMLKEEETAYDIHFIPGLSSVLYLIDKMGGLWEKAELVSNHGTSANVPAKLLHHSQVCTLLGYEGQVADICRRLTEVGLGDTPVLVGERLSYADEKITKNFAKNLCESSFDRLAVAMFLNAKPQARRLAPGIPDDAFIRGNVPMTKEEVRAAVISKLRITDYVAKDTPPVIYDVGAGTGSVSVEMALLTETGTVYAIEQHPKAVELLYENRRKFHTGNMEILAGEATGIIPELPAPTHVFIGGSGGNMLKIVEQVYQKNVNARIVITSVTMETQAELFTLAEMAKETGRKFDMLQMAVTRITEVGRYHMQQAENPVWIATISS